MPADLVFNTICVCARPLPPTWRRTREALRVAQCCALGVVAQALCYALNYAARKLVQPRNRVGEYLLRNIIRNLLVCLAVPTRLKSLPRVANIRRALSRMHRFVKSLVPDETHNETLVGLRFIPRPSTPTGVPSETSDETPADARLAPGLPPFVGVFYTPVIYLALLCFNHISCCYAHIDNVTITHLHR